MKNKEYIYSQLENFQIDPDEPVFTTGVVCRLLDIPVWVLKKLDEEKIVSPQRKNDLDARLYSLKELSLVKHCWKYMNEHRVKVHGLKIILHMEFKR
jgi:DNA-binding transcriptional MerR regulator